MSGQRSLSRRDFLRLRTTEQGRVVELSCRALYMRCADAVRPTEQVDYDSIVGEPPAVFERRSPEDIIEGVQAELSDAQVLRLLEPEWIDNMPCADQFRAVVDRFQQRGGRIEKA